MSIASLRFLPTSRGTLVILRRKLELVKRGKEILEMRRDQLIREIFALMDQLKKRRELEQKFVETLEALARLRAMRGEWDFEGTTKLVKPAKAEILLVSFQGIPVPQAKIRKDPDFSEIKDPEYRRLAESLWKTILEFIELAGTEEAVIKLGEYLAYINRIVNSLDRNIIPQLEETIRYIEERLSDEMLEEFVRLKKISEMLRGRP